jgi:hypothetical protein
MNKLTYAALIGAAAAHGHKGQHHNQKVDKKQLEEIVGGLLRGAIDAEGFDDIDSCIKDAETVFGDAKIAVSDFKKGDAAGAIAGIKEIADIMKVVESGMKDCTSIKADWDKLVKMVSIFDSPTSFAYHVGKDLIVNGKQIYGEITTAVSDYEAGNWGDFGYQIGEAAAKTLLGETELAMFATQDSKMKEAQIMQGFLTAFGGKFDLYALLMCIYEEDQAVLMFDVAVQTFEEAIAKKDPSEAIGGIIAIIAGVAQFKKGLPACEAIDTKTFNFEQMDQCFDVAVHPTQYFKVLERDLLVNNYAIMKDVEQAIKAYKSEKFFEFGELMGKIVEIATETKEEALTVVASPDAHEINRQMITEFAQGFFETTQVGDFNFTNLLICIYEADQAALILYQAVEMLEEAYHDKDVNEAIGGVIATVAFL